MTTLTKPAATSWTDWHIGPRVVGGTYLDGYWGREYEVLGIERETGDWMEWSITVRWADGHVGVHGTAWDYSRDRVGGVMTYGAFKSDATFKRQLVDEMKHHVADERAMHGSHWNGGSAAGPSCTVVDHTPHDTLIADGFDWREELPRITGIPADLHDVSDWLYQQLPAERKNDWALRVLEAVPLGLARWDRDDFFEHFRGTSLAGAELVSAMADRFLVHIARVVA